MKIIYSKYTFEEVHNTRRKMDIAKKSLSSYQRQKQKTFGKMGHLIFLILMKNGKKLRLKNESL